MKSGWMLAGMLMAGAGSASAQSSVTLYGLISEGLMYTSNSGDHSLVELASGLQQGSRFGLKGSEDLGSGSRAIFTLENGFSASNGALLQGGRLFGRQAFVGLANEQLGQLTFGRQYDTMALSMGVLEAALQFATYGPPIGDNDNLFSTFHVNNMVQYQSPTVAGVRFLTSYAFSNKAGAFADNSDFNAGLTYANGPINLAVAYHILRLPNDANNTGGAVSGDYGYTSPFVKSPTTGAAVSRQEIYGTGGSYAFGSAKLSLIYTHTLFEYIDQMKLNLSNYEVTVTDYISPSMLIGAGYIYTDGRYESTGKAPKWHQVDAGVDWFLSKRTDLFLVGIFQRAAGDATYAQIYNNSPSSTREQFSASVGIRHKF